ncbi:ion channel [Alcanivorax sp.]|uniref:ion channel n=1 Tax=Alcanivorax TaxID=59753 RepID=UPI0025BDF9DA|nr:ion channel [Alcanivorax sp.]
MSEVLFASMVSLGMVLTTVTLHYWTLAGLSALLKRWSGFRGEILLVVMVMFVAHMLEVTLYAWAYLILDRGDTAMNLAGTVDGSFLDHLYFSTACYTSLGLGDLYPLGTLRLIAGVEALNGLILITWSASFAFLVMQRRWRF